MFCWKKFDSYAAQISYASTGAQVLFGTYDGAVDGKPLAHGIRPLGFLLANPIRKTRRRPSPTLPNRAWRSKLFPGIIR